MCGTAFLIMVMVIAILVYTIFPLNPTWQMLFLSYPISWLVTGLIQFAAFLFVKKRATARAAE